MNDVVTSIITIRQKEIHTEKTFQQIGKTCHDHFDTATKTSEYNERSLGELGNKLLTHKTTLSLLAQSHQKTHHHKQPFSLQDSITYKATMDEVVEIVCDWLDTYDASWYKSLLNNNRQQENYYSFDDKSRYDKALKEYVAIHALPALLRQYHRIILEPQLFATYKKVYNEDFYEHQLDRDKAAQYAYIQKLVYLKNEYPRLEAILENGQRYYQ